MIENAFSLKIGIAIVVIVAAGGATLFFHDNRSVLFHSGSGVSLTVSGDADHTANWYIAHPDILKQDEGRCAGDATRISQAACQNVASADNQLGMFEMQKAAAQDGSTDKPGKQ